MVDLNINEIKEDIGKFLERIFLERKVAKDLGFDVSEIDEYIKSEGARQLQRFEEMSVEEAINYMLNEIKDFIDQA